MAIKILVVDDEPPILELLKTMLESLGCEVVASEDGRDAARLVGTRKFDGIFLDARMPHVDGFQLTEEVRRSPSNRSAPVVMITGSDDAQTMRKGFQAGITLFVAKPISLDRVVHTVNALRGAFLKEKRRYIRLVYRGEVICESPNLPQAKLGALDLSEGGMALMHAGGLTVGQLLNLQFRLPGVAEVLRLYAKVVRQMPPDGVAVSFVKLSPDELKALQSYIGGTVK